MHPGSVDPRRPEKVQRYKPPSANTNGQGEDLTPDYMNILGQRATTANAPNEPDKHVVVDGGHGSNLIGGGAGNGGGLIGTTSADHHHHHNAQFVVGEAGVGNSNENDNLNNVVVSTSGATTTTNVIPTSPQYGVAIISSNVSIADLPTDTVTIATDTVTDSKHHHQQQQAPPPPQHTQPQQIPPIQQQPVQQPVDDGKDLHSTPSRNDRFKVVKIASLEPFKRGRWKCMDYVDEAPPPQPIAQQSKVAQSSSGSIQVQANAGPTATAAGAGSVYLQTQSLPQQQIQQMLMQSGFTNGTQFFQNVPAQMMQPQTQYFYPTGAGNLQTQTLPQQLVSATGAAGGANPAQAAQFINAATGQPYFVQNSGYAIPAANYQNVQYVPANLIQQNHQNSAFVPTSQTVQMPANFQQSQTYGGQPTMVNGHAYPNEQQQQQVTSSSIPTQPAKSVILNTNVQQPVVSQTMNQAPPPQQQNPMVQNSTQSQSVPVIQNQQQQPPQQYQTQSFQPNVLTAQQPPPQQQQQQIPTSQTLPAQQQQVFDQNAKVQVQAPPPQQLQQQPQMFEQVVDNKNQQQQQQQLANNVYTNPQFDMNVNSLTVLENAAEVIAEHVNNAISTTEVQSQSDNADDPSKTNPVVNAIDNKIEQAMDLVKSHLMYTVREEVEVLKEKIAELMEKIQLLETENNFLRSQIPKSTTTTPAPGTPQVGTATIGTIQAPVSVGGGVTPILTTSATVVQPTTTTTTNTAPLNEQQQQQQQ